MFLPPHSFPTFITDALACVLEWLARSECVVFLAVRAIEYGFQVLHASLHP